MLLDFFMPGMTGDQIVRRVRETNELVRIILVTGYAGEKPAREMMRQLDIQGYHDKSEGAERLLLWIDAALNTYRHVRAVERYSVRLQRVLDAAPSLYKMQSLDTLLGRLVEQTGQLLEADSAFLATLPRERISATTRELFDGVEVFVALDGPEFRDVPLEVRYGTGRFAGGHRARRPAGARALDGLDALRNGEVQADNERSVIPLRLGDRSHRRDLRQPRHGGSPRPHGAGDLREPGRRRRCTTRCSIEGATVDSLTGAFRRGFALQRLQQMLKDAHRRGEPVSAMMVDLDHFKQVNDRFGHYVGDRALASVAARAAAGAARDRPRRPAGRRRVPGGAARHAGRGRARRRGAHRPQRRGGEAAGAGCGDRLPAEHGHRHALLRRPSRGPAGPLAARRGVRAGDPAAGAGRRRGALCGQALRRRAHGHAAGLGHGVRRRPGGGGGGAAPLTHGGRPPGAVRGLRGACRIVRQAPRSLMEAPMRSKSLIPALALAGLVAAGCGRAESDRDHADVVPPGAIPAPPQGTATPGAAPGAAGDPRDVSTLPAGEQLPGEPALGGGAAGAVQVDTPRATDPARTPR
jgi:CheY-like chemotaxis protein